MKKKILSLLTVFAMILAFSMTAYAESAQDETVIPDRYNYTNTIYSILSISNNTATCTSRVTGNSSLVTKIEITQSLEELLPSGWWYRHQSWSKTFYNWYAIYTTTGTIPYSGTYHVRTVAKVYAGSNYETISIYSNNVTV